MTEHDFNGSPGRLLASFFVERAPPAPPGALVLVCGLSGAGKTTWCSALQARAAELGLTTGGLLSPGVFAAGQKVAIDLWALGYGVRRLARPRAKVAGEEFSLAWSFDPQVLAWGNTVLESLLDPAVTPPDVAIIDELGPLEFQHHTGLTAGLALAAARRSPLTCLALRPSLLGLALERWPWAQVIHLPGPEAAV